MLIHTCVPVRATTRQMCQQPIVVSTHNWILHEPLSKIVCVHMSKCLRVARKIAIHPCDNSSLHAMCTPILWYFTIQFYSILVFQMETVKHVQVLD